MLLVAPLRHNPADIRTSRTKFQAPRALRSRLRPRHYCASRCSDAAASPMASGMSFESTVNYFTQTPIFRTGFRTLPKLTSNSVRFPAPYMKDLDSIIPRLIRFRDAPRATWVWTAIASTPRCGPIWSKFVSANRALHSTDLNWTPLRSTIYLATGVPLNVQETYYGTQKNPRA